MSPPGIPPGQVPRHLSIVSAPQVTDPGPAAELAGLPLTPLSEVTAGAVSAEADDPAERAASVGAVGHPDPERFAAEFSGTERTVAEYLLAEVLDRQPEPVRRLLLRTSILERVNGELASLLTGDEGAERVLQDLEQASAFVMSLDARRSWFRYHQLFAGLLRLELRHAEPGELAGLRGFDARAYGRRQYPVAPASDEIEDAANGGAAD